MHRTHKQNGSAHVIVIIILAVALVGALSVVFYQNFIAKRADDTTKTVNDAQEMNVDSTVATQKTADTEAQTPAIDPNKYLVLDDWGVKLELPQDGTSILYQKYSSATAAGSYDAYLFTTKTVNGYGGYCVLDSARPGSAIMSIERRSQKYTDGPGAQMPLNNGEPLNGYYYYIMPVAGSACSPDNEAKIIADRDVLRQVARSITVK